jgi:molybdopterin converting factor small subunit
MSNRVEQRTSTESEDTDGEPAESTAVELRCTGHVRGEVGSSGFTYEFEGTTLRALLADLFEEYPIEEMLIAETERDATTEGWAPEFGELPGSNYAKNPEGEQTRPYARVAVNGQFNEHLDGLDTELDDGDRVALMYPFIYCC